MKSTFKKQHGTALLVTILLAGAISLVAFGMTKVALNEIFVGTKGEEGLQAFYAAQAGIDDGLMRFKFHDKADLSVPEDATEESTKVVRVYINKNAGDARKVSEVPINTRPILTADDYVYDLKVWYKQVCVDNDDCVYDLKKDESILLDVSEVSTFKVYWDVVIENNQNYTNYTINSGGENTGLWYRLSDPLTSSQLDCTGQNRDFFTFLSPYQGQGTSDPRFNSCGNYKLPRGSYSLLNTRTAKSIKFKAFLAEGLPDNVRILIKVRTTQADDLIGGPKTYIESTGYYGNTAKKIVATIDRDSKSIIDVFDYVIYSGQGPLPRR